MAKNLVVCCDGTWNDPDELRDHVAKPTNVAKLALALVSDVDKSAGQQSQLMHYEPGVGTTADERLIGGAFGYGLSRSSETGIGFWPRTMHRAIACTCSASAGVPIPPAAWPA